MASTLTAAAEQTTRSLPAPPIVIGALTFALLLTLMLTLLMFGKGRPHS